MRGDESECIAGGYLIIDCRSPAPECCKKVSVNSSKVAVLVHKYKYKYNTRVQACERLLAKHPGKQSADLTCLGAYSCRFRHGESLSTPAELSSTRARAWGGEGGLEQSTALS